MPWRTAGAVRRAKVPMRVMDQALREAVIRAQESEIATLRAFLARPR